MLVHVDDDGNLPVKIQEAPYTAIAWTLVRCECDRPINTAQLSALSATDLYVAIHHYDCTDLPDLKGSARKKFICAYCGQQFSYELHSESVIRLNSAKVQWVQLV